MHLKCHQPSPNVWIPCSSSIICWVPGKQCVVLLAHSHSRRNPAASFPLFFTVFTLFWLINDSRGVLPVYEPAHWPTHATETTGSTHTRHLMTKKITRLILSDPGSLWWSYCMLVKEQLCSSSDAYLWHNESSASVNCALGNIYREINFLLLLPLANNIK